MRGVIFVKELLTDESCIYLVDGTKIEGAENIDKFIFNCCRKYSQGFIEKRDILLATGVLAGVAIGITAIVSINKFRKKKTQK